MMPPSPPLSARITKVTYLIETSIVIVQKTSETTPYTSAVVACTAWLSAVNTVCSAYSGLVPMSPKTTPRAPNASAATPVPTLDLAPSPPRGRGSAGAGPPAPRGRGSPPGGRGPLWRGGGVPHG